MDIREKIGQRLVFGFPGTTIPAEFAALVCEYKIGNVILFRYNIESLPQLARLCADIQELIRGATGRDAFITIDQEGGMVTRLPWDAVNVPGSMALAATGKPENAVLAAEITARQLRGVGVNFNLAPDLDVNSNPMNPVIGVRSFGDDPERVALFGAKAVDALLRQAFPRPRRHRRGFPHRASVHRENDGRARSVRAHFVPCGDQGGHSRHNEQSYPLSEH